jgi:hypothetical protein
LLRSCRHTKAERRQNILFEDFAGMGRIKHYIHYFDMS